MVIGIVDLDLIFRRGQYQINLDIMQITSYHRRLGDKVRFCLSIKPEDLQWYSQLYVIYNGVKEIFIDSLINDDRTILVGSYFYGTYCPLSQEIKDSYPDKSIYEDLMTKLEFSDIKGTELRGRLKKADFIRLHEPSNRRFLTNNPEVVLHDLDLTDKDYEDILNLNKEFMLFYPLTVRTYAQALKWIEAGAFARQYSTRTFIAENMTEEDYFKIINLPLAKRKMFILRFGKCSPEFYNFELKKCLRILAQARFLTPKPFVEISPIQNNTYDFLFGCARKWYYSIKAKDQDLDIFHTYFNNKPKYDLIIKIKAKDPELYQLLTSTLSRRYQDEQARKNYRRVD